MKIFRYWKIILGLVLVFGAGAVTGSVATQQMIKRALESGLKLDNWTANTTDFLQKKLRLSPDQRNKVKAIFEQKGPQFKSVFGRTATDCGQLFIQMEHQVDLELTPEQRLTHAELKRKFRADLKSKFDFDLPLE